jgi:hypothetical protein
VTISCPPLVVDGEYAIIDEDKLGMVKC